MNHKLITKRLVLRPFTLDDIEVSYRMNLDEAVTKYTADGGVVSYEEISKRITNVVNYDYKLFGYGRFAVELIETGEFIGFCGLKYLEDYQETDLGYRFFSKYWGMGYATEASKACVEWGFKTLGLESIMAMVLPDNKASIHVLEKLGFELTGEIVEGGHHALRFDKQLSEVSS